MESGHGVMVQSLARGLRILGWLAEDERGLTLAEIADRLGVSRPTAFNLAGTLVAHGFATKTARPVLYRLGPTVGLLHARQCRSDWTRRIETEVARLAEHLPECFLLFAENVGGDLRVLLRFDPGRPGTVERTSTRPITPYVTALSLAYLAFGGSEDRLRYEREYPFAEHGSGRWQSRDLLEAALERGRQDGFLELTEGALSRVVVPVRRAGEKLSGLLCASHHAPTGAGAAEQAPRIRREVLASADRIHAEESNQPCGEA